MNSSTNKQQEEQNPRAAINSGRILGGSAIYLTRIPASLDSLKKKNQTLDISIKTTPITIDLVINSQQASDSREKERGS